MTGQGPNPRRANGHRRDQVRRRVLAEEFDCWLCGKPVDKTLTNVVGKHGQKCKTPECVGCSPHPMRAEVDEIVRVADGGSPIDRSNCRLSHRHCNRYRDVPDAQAQRDVVSISTTRSW